MVKYSSLTDREYHKFVDLDNSSGDTAVRTLGLGTLVPEEFDYLSLGYTGENLTSVIYKLGGSTGNTVATLTLGYTGDKLTSVEKT